MFKGIFLLLAVLPFTLAQSPVNSPVASPVPSPSPSASPVVQSPVVQSPVVQSPVVQSPIVPPTSPSPIVASPSPSPTVVPAPAPKPKISPNPKSPSPSPKPQSPSPKPPNAAPPTIAVAPPPAEPPDAPACPPPAKESPPFRTVSSVYNQGCDNTKIINLKPYQVIPNIGNYKVCGARCDSTYDPVSYITPMSFDYNTVTKVCRLFMENPENNETLFDYNSPGYVKYQWDD